MNLIKEKFETTRPLASIFQEDWKNALKGCDNVSFDSLDQFIYTVSKLKQKDDYMCEIPYKKALENLTKRQSDFPKSEQESIRNLVRKNLLKRGLITGEVYEDFRYTNDGTQVGIDVGKYAAGESDCVISPSRQYIDFFYELYINVSYSYGVSNKNVRKNVAKLLATVEELERQHVFIKITVVLPIDNIKRNTETGETNKFFSSIPVFSHKDFKSVDTMSAVVNERLLRKFYFAVLEELYGSNLSGNYGYVATLKNSMSIGDNFDEVALFNNIKNSVGA
jgi:hypothetical protein